MEIFFTDAQRSERVVVDDFVFLRWQPSMNEKTSWKMELPIKYKDKILLNDIIEGSFSEYQGIVNQIVDDDNEQKTFTINGLFINFYLLNQRTYNNVLELSEVKFKNLINTLFNQLTEERALNVNIEYLNNVDSVKISYSGGEQSLYDIISEVCVGYDIGFKVKLLNDASYVLTFYLGNDLTDDIIMTDDLDRIQEQTYIEDNAAYKNMFYVKDRDGNIITVDVREDDEEMVEGFLDCSSFNSTKTGTAYQNSLREYALNEIYAKYNFVNSIDIVIDENYAVFEKQFNLGDTIRVGSKKHNAYFNSKVNKADIMFDNGGKVTSIEFGTKERLVNIIK